MRESEIASLARKAARLAVFASVLAVSMATAACGKEENASPTANRTPTVAPANPNPSPQRGPRPPDFGLYTLKPGTSSIEWEASKITGSHKGSFSSFDGHIEVLEPMEPNRIELDIDMNSVVTTEEKLTKHLKSPDFFDVAKFPNAHFRLQKFEPISEGASNYRITGDLMLHGQTKPVTFPATVTIGGGHVKATADVVINRKDFGIVYPGKPDDLIRDNVVVHLNVDAAKR